VGWARHPVTLLWGGRAGPSAVILTAVQAVAAGTLPLSQAEACIAAALIVWSQQWAWAQAMLAHP
jgi:hypothetical protein